MTKRICIICGAGTMLIPRDDGLYCGTCGSHVPLERLRDVYEEKPQRAT